MNVTFDDFLTFVPDEHKSFVTSLHEQLIKQGCTINIKEVKSGYAASYQWEKKTVMNWVFGKSGTLARIYGNNVGKYESVIAALPVDMQNKMTGSRNCKRLLDPAACSDTCVKGFVYTLNENTYKKCRNDGMFFLLSDETSQHIQKLITAEVSVRQSALL